MKDYFSGVVWPYHWVGAVVLAHPYACEQSAIFNVEIYSSDYLFYVPKIFPQDSAKYLVADTF